MGNLFLGFPVSRAKIADMITGTAAPSAHHTQHENGGSDEIDITGLTGGGGGGGGIGDVYNYGSIIESLDSYFITPVGSASTIIGYQGAVLDTGASSGSVAVLQRNRNGWSTHLSFDRNRAFFIEVSFYSYTSKLGKLIISTYYDLTKKQIGFKVVDGILYGTVGNGAAETTVALETLSTGSYNETRYLKALFTAGVKCEFYSNGVLKGTIITGLPSGGDYGSMLFYATANNVANAEVKGMEIFSWNYQASQ